MGAKGPIVRQIEQLIVRCVVLRQPEGTTIYFNTVSLTPL